MIKNNGALAEQIFLEYKSRIYGYIYGKGVPFSEADDVFSEIMLKASACAGSYDNEKSSLSTWVYMVCRSAAINYLKKRKPEYPLAEDAPSDFDLERGVEIEEELRELARQLELLPDREKRVIVLRFYKDMEYREIARTMNLSETNARVLCSRAVGKLKERMTAG